MIGKDWSSLRKLMVLGGVSGSKAVEDTVVGNPVQFSTDLAKKLKSLNVNFAPVQSGTGVPSPSNIRPITGWTGLNICRTGKNLFGTTFVNGNIATNDGIITKYPYVTNRLLCDDFIELPPGTYTISSKEETQSTIYFYRTADESSYVYSERLSSWEDNPRSFTLTEKRCVQIVLRKSDNSNLPSSDVTEFQIETGTTATGYELFKGTTIPVSWQTEEGEVYGGTLDALTGVLSVEYGIYDIGSLSWEVVNGSGQTKYFRSSVLEGIKKIANTGVVANIYCSILKTVSAASIYSGAAVDNSIGQDDSETPRIRVKATSYNDDATAFKTAMNGIMLVYELAEPQTAQLDPVALSTLMGDNVIWSNANGDIEVKYLKKG